MHNLKSENFACQTSEVLSCVVEVRPYCIEATDSEDFEYYSQ